MLLRRMFQRVAGRVYLVVGGGGVKEYLERCFFFLAMLLTLCRETCGPVDWR